MNEANNGTLVIFKTNCLIKEKICPQIHKIDPRTTSIEQLDLEKKIMEERIRDLFIKKTSAFKY